MALVLALRMVYPRTWIALVALVMVAVCGQPAWAQPAPSAEDIEESKARFAAGNKAFEKGDFRDAVNEFQAGYLLTRSGGFLLNIAVCYRKMGEGKKALESFRDYLKAEPQSPRRREVEKQVAELQAQEVVTGKADHNEPARLSDGSLDPAAPPANPPVAKPLVHPTPRAVPMPTNAAASADPNAPRIDSAEEDDGVALVVGTRRRGAPARVEARAIKKSEPDDDENSGSGNHLWLWAAAGGVVVAGVVAALALSGGPSQNGSLGSVDLR